MRPFRNSILEMLGDSQGGRGLLRHGQNVLHRVIHRKGFRTPKISEIGWDSKTASHLVGGRIETQRPPRRHRPPAGPSGTPGEPHDDGPGRVMYLDRSSASRGLCGAVRDEQHGQAAGGSAGVGMGEQHGVRAKWLMLLGCVVVRCGMIT